MNNTTNAFFTRRRRPGHGHGHTQRRNARHRPRPLPLLEAIDGLSQALADLRTSLGIAQSSRTDRLAWPQQQPQQAIAMPWLSDSQAPETPQTSTEQDPDCGAAPGMSCRCVNCGCCCAAIRSIAAPFLSRLRICGAPN
jgi:hypothetical protein